MKKFLVIAVGAVLILCVLLSIFHSCTGKKVAALEEQIAYLEKTMVPLRFKILSKNDSGIKVVVSTYDLDGEKVGSKEYTVPGNELHVDTRVIKLSNGEHLFFPYGLYSDSMAMKDAFPIYDIYDKDGYPAIYSNLEGHSKEDLDKDSVIAIYTEVKDYFTLAKGSMTESMKNMHGVAVHDLQSLADFKIGFVYQLLCHPHSGGVEIVRE